MAARASKLETMTTLLVGLVLLKGQAIVGPKILFNMANGKSFTIQTDAKNAPKTAAGIVALVKKGFYDKQRVHRVEDWVTQWGDPKSKNGVDIPGVGGGQNSAPLPFEAGTLSFTKGTVGIASTGTGVGGDCQLFVVKRDSAFLNGGYSAMGRVVAGMNVVMNIQRGDKILSARIVK